MHKRLESIMSDEDYATQRSPVQEDRAAVRLGAHSGEVSKFGPNVSRKFRRHNLEPVDQRRHFWMVFCHLFKIGNGKHDISQRVTAPISLEFLKYDLSSLRLSSSGRSFAAVG
jgi:hypothetical protein